MMQYLTKALLAACWFMLLTFPVMGIKLNSVDQTVEWQFDRVILLGVAIFFLSMLWNWCFSRKARGIPLIRLPEGLGKGLHSLVTLPNRNTTTRLTSLGLLLAVMIVMPLVSSFYQTNIMISAMLYVILALGLNIAVGIAGQLVLGYVAFYAVGAYSYALLNQAFGLGFWACLPVGGFMAIVFGLALGFPVLRLRGDYLPWASARSCAWCCSTGPASPAVPAASRTSPAPPSSARSWRSPPTPSSSTIWCCWP